MMLHLRARGGNLGAPSSAAKWAIRTLPPRAQAFLVAVEVAAAAMTAALLSLERPSAQIAVRFAVLLAVSVGYAELGRRSERVRRYLGAGSTTPRPNPLAVWSFAALLLLPAGWAAAFVVAQHAHLWWQRRRDRSGVAYRVVFTGAAATLAQLAAAAVLDQSRPGGVLDAHFLASLSIVVGALVYTAIDLTVMLVGVWLATRPPSLRAMLPDADAVGFEVACLVCGLGAAEIALRTPWLVPLMVTPVLYLHRSAMIKSLHRAARTDVKTGLLNAAGWSDQARASLSRCERGGASAAVLVLDIDRFKQVNDDHGHLAGDRVLGEIALALRRELRGHDGIGRFGGDEFVVVLEDVSVGAAHEIADRLHRALRTVQAGELPVTTSMGLAHTAGTGFDLTALLAAADGALYEAKRAGRDCVRIAATVGDVAVR